MEITSTTNNLVKEVSKLAQKKYRAESNLFLIEGQKAVEEAFSLNIEFENIFVLKEKANKYLQFKNLILTNEAVLKKISTVSFLGASGLRFGSTSLFIRNFILL